MTGPAAEVLSEGELLDGRYRIGALLGEGGYGRVYRATQLPLGREVAIKIMNGDDAELAERFNREAAVIQRLEHPNTVRVLDFGVSARGHRYLALELLRGSNVDQLLDAQQTLSPEVALAITAQVLKSLAEAHQKGIVHRDIKPGNVFVTSHFGEPVFVKVLDFGIAKQLSATHKLTVHGETIGTPSYMSPEQAMGLPVDGRSDLYAVGLMLAEMITGKLVFGRGGPMTILEAQAGRAAVPLPAAVTASVVGPVVTRAVQKRPQDRYQSAGEMLEATESVLHALRHPPAQAAATPPAAGQATHAATALPKPADTRPEAPGLTLHAASQPPPARTLAAPGPTQHAQLVVPRAGPPARQRSKASVARSPLVIGLAALVAVLTVLVVVLLTRDSQRKPARSADDDDDDAVEAPRPSSKKPRRDATPPSPPTPPPPLLDPRVVPLGVGSIAGVRAALKNAGYELTTDDGDAGGSMRTFIAQKPPCVGTVAILVFTDDSATRVANSSLSTSGGRVLADDRTVASVFMSRMGGPSPDSACTDAVVGLLQTRRPRPPRPVDRRR